MRVLVLDSDSPDVARAVDELDRAGHTVAFVESTSSSAAEACASAVSR